MATFAWTKDERPRTSFLGLRSLSRSNMVQRAVILAAGRGKRLAPHTDTTPKPLLPVNGRPTLDYILTALQNASVTDVCLVTHYLGEQIEAYVGNGDRWHLQVTYRRQPHMWGTADALRTAADFITEPCFVIAADYALAENHLADMKAIYLARCQTFDVLKTSDVSVMLADRLMAVSLAPMAWEELADRSSARLDPDGNMLEIVEKPALGAAPSNLVAYLIYIVPPSVRQYLPKVRLSRRQEYELPDAVNMMIRDGYQVVGVVQSAPTEWEQRR